MPLRRRADQEFLKTPYYEPVMEELVEQVRESCSAAVLDGLDIVYVLRLPTHKIMRTNLGVGSRLPAPWTSMGRVLLAGRGRGLGQRAAARLVS